MQDKVTMEALIGGLIAFAALIMLFDLLLRGHRVAKPDTKPPRELVFAQGILVASLALGLAATWKLLPMPGLTVSLAAILLGVAVVRRGKLIQPTAPQSVVIDQK